MIHILKAQGKHCAGCGACTSICPVSAITMTRDSEGFLTASIDQEACIHCGLCEKTCPVLHPDYSNDEPVCYAMAASTEERMDSSSGGIFPLLAHQTILDGGIVFGAVWNDDFSVSIKSAQTDEELAPLRKSKYVQACTENTFNEARDALRQGRKVLYSGCPCHIAGLKARLGDDALNENLLTVDVVCHGTPAPAVLQKYLDERFGLDNVANLSFRDKATFGWSTREHVELVDGSQVNSNPSPFMEAFNPCLIMGHCCGECPFSRLPRQADLTLGDFWGIDKFRPDLNDQLGLSVVLASSERGRSALERIRDQLIINEEVPLEWATDVNKTIIHPYPNHSGRKHFYSAMHLKPFEELRDNSLMHHYDIGVVGLWYGINFGSILTYYALYVALRSCGYDVVMLPRPEGLWPDYFGSFDTIAQRFMWDHCNVFLPYMDREEYILANESCDQFVVGSDVVWSHRICGSFVDQFFFLDWVKRDRKKVSYAASLADGLYGPEAYVQKALYHLGLFDAISVRETSGVDQLTKLTGREDIANTLDPVFLCNRAVYDGIMDEEPEAQSESNFVFSYILRDDLRDLKRRVIAMAKELHNATLRITGDANDLPTARSIVADVACPHDEFLEEMTVPLWLRSVRDCAFYVGDSYHAACFSLIYHVPFAIVYSPNDYAFKRIESLLTLLGLESRLITEYSTKEQIQVALEGVIDWEHVDEILGIERARSLAWLQGALKLPKRQLSVGDYLHDDELDRRLYVAREMRALREEASRLQGEIDARQNEIVERQGEIEALREEVRRSQEVRDDLANVVASRSFRIGRMLTWLPRHLRDGLNGQ